MHETLLYGVTTRSLYREDSLAGVPGVRSVGEYR
jgi:hypothetical protein